MEAGHLCSSKFGNSKFSISGFPLHQTVLEHYFRTIVLDRHDVYHERRMVSFSMSQPFFSNLWYALISNVVILMDVDGLVKISQAGMYIRFVNGVSDPSRENSEA